MKPFNATIIRFNWKEKISITNENRDDVGKRYTNLNCLYQVYGNSPIYGNDALLYIGRTNNFEQRLEQHLNSDFMRIPNLSIIVGKIDKECNDVPNFLEITECLLITMLKPSYNSFNVKDTGAKLKKGIKYLILNCGNRGDLPLEISNYWW
jgi:hypothetical protein